MKPLGQTISPFTRGPRRRLPAWAQALPAALGISALITALIAALYYYWFAVADRYAIFLYYHAQAGPFDARTVSRYRMAGLVAGGVVLLLYTAGNLAAGRLAALAGRRYTPPAWRLVWGLSALPSAAAVVLITTTQNAPVLPLPLALSCAAVMVAALAPALAAGVVAATAPGRLVWWAAAGLGVTPCLLLLRAVELPGLGLGIAPALAYGVGVGAALTGLCWLLIVSWAAGRRAHAPFQGPAQGVLQGVSQGALPPHALFVAALCISYLLLPLAHHLFFTPPDHPYITVADNFFAISPLVQAACLAAAYAAAWMPAGLHHLLHQLRPLALSHKE